MTLFALNVEARSQIEAREQQPRTSAVMAHLAVGLSCENARRPCIICGAFKVGQRPLPSLQSFYQRK